MFDGVITAYNALIAPMLSKVCTHDPRIVRAIKVILNIGVIGSVLALFTREHSSVWRSHGNL